MGRSFFTGPDQYSGYLKETIHDDLPLFFPALLKKGKSGQHCLAWVLRVVWMFERTRRYILSLISTNNPYQSINRIHLLIYNP